MLDYTIKAGVGSMLRSIIADVLAGAELAVVRGEVGIGKSYALSFIETELRDAGVTVVRVTITPVLDANINAFLRAVLGPNCMESGSGADAEAAVWEMLAGNPFVTWGRRVILIIDEAQGLSGRVLEVIRGLWDRGDAARLGDEAAPAFGCILVGNSTFMTKGGKQRVQAYRPLLDRLAYDVTLPGPNQAECPSYAGTVFPGQADLQAELAELGKVRGNFRSMAIASRIARTSAGDGPVTLAHLRLAIKNMGGK